jgi:hypothetical protein
MADRKQIYVDSETEQRLTALSRIYGSNAAAVRAAIELLARRHFHPTSFVEDDVLDAVLKHCQQAVAVLESELMRRDEQA